MALIGSIVPQQGLPEQAQHVKQAHLQASASPERRDVRGIQPKPQRVQLDQAPDLKHP